MSDRSEGKLKWCPTLIPNAAGLLYTLSFNNTLFHLILCDKVYAFVCFIENKVMHSKIEVFLIFLIYLKSNFYRFLSLYLIRPIFLLCYRFLKIYNHYLVCCLLCLYLKAGRICQVLPNNRLSVIFLIFLWLMWGWGGVLEYTVQVFCWK